MSVEDVSDPLLDRATCDWSSIAWSLPAGLALRARIEDAQERLKASEAALAETASAYNADEAGRANLDGLAASADSELEKSQAERRALEEARAMAASALEEGLRAAGSVTKAQLEEVRTVLISPDLD